MILEDVLQAAAVDYRVSNSNKYELTLSCPFCEDRGFSQDESYHLGLNILKGLGHCFRCGWKLRGVIPIAKELSEVYGVKVSLLGKHEGLQEQPKEEVKPAEELEPVSLPLGYERFSSKPDRIELKARNYLRNRQVSLLQITRHKIGYTAIGDMAWRIIFPVLDVDSKVVGWVARSFAGAKPKYLNSGGLKGLWNAQKSAKTAVVVEGIMDALRVEQALLQVRDSVAIARLGSVITQLQLNLLKQYENIVIFPDADKPGIKGALELASKCDDCNMNVGVVVPAAMTGLDPGNMNEAEILDHLRGARQFTSDVANRLREVACRYEY